MNIIDNEQNKTSNVQYNTTFIINERGITINKILDRSNHKSKLSSK